LKGKNTMKKILFALCFASLAAFAADIYFDAPLSLPPRTVTGFAAVTVQPSLDSGDWLVRGTPIFSPPLMATVGDVAVTGYVTVMVKVKAAELVNVPVIATNAREAQTKLREAATRIALAKVQAALLTTPAKTNAVVR
jgi:hypothetical protein